MGGLATGPLKPPDARDAPAQPWRLSRYSDRLLVTWGTIERQFEFRPAFSFGSNGHGLANGASAKKKAGVGRGRPEEID